MQDADSIIGSEQTGNPNWTELPAEMWEMIMGHLECGESNNLIMMALFSEGAENIIEGLPFRMKDIISTLVFKAIKEEDLKTLEALLKNVDINDRYEHGDTLLHLAIRAGNFKAIKILAQKGADINAENAKGETPLNMAIKSTKLAIVEPLLYCYKEADISAAENLDKTPLNPAVFMENSNAVKLPNEKAVPLNILLFKAVRKIQRFRNRQSEKYLDLISFLIDKGANPNAKYKGCTPLHIAAIIGIWEVVNLLLQKGANANEKNKDGQSPLDLAIDNQRCAYVVTLLQAGVQFADRVNDTLRYRYRHGETLLHRAAREGFCELVEVCK